MVLVFNHQINSFVISFVICQLVQISSPRLCPLHSACLIAPIVLCIVTFGTQRQHHRAFLEHLNATSTSYPKYHLVPSIESSVHSFVIALCFVAALPNHAAFDFPRAQPYLLCFLVALKVSRFVANHSESARTAPHRTPRCRCCPHLLLIVHHR